MAVANDKGFSPSVKALDAAARRLSAAHWALATYLGDLDGHGHPERAIEPDADTLGGLIWHAYKAAFRVAEASRRCRRSEAGAAAIGRALRYIVPLADNSREALARWPELVDAQTVACVNYARADVQGDNYHTPANRPILRVAERCKHWPRDCEPTVEAVADWLGRWSKVDGRLRAHAAVARAMSIH